MHFCSMPMYLVSFTTPLTMCRRLIPLPEMQPQTIIFRGCFTVRFRNSSLNTSPGNLLTYVFACMVSKQAESAFIADQDLLPHPTTLAGALPCPLDSLAPLDISHQRLFACLAAH